ncbi:hypothetical protein LXA43DRAFT_1160169 [Ganoderma leucocontextum]|nr:hypothetical protein LXA43DRAFT_1160169 [Ganoderma leucocontextum]
MASKEEKKRKKAEEKAAKQAERAAKKQKKSHPEVEAPPRFVVTANGSTSNDSAPPSQASPEASRPPSQASTSSNANDGAQDTAPGSNSDPPSDDTAVDNASENQQRSERPLRARLPSDQLASRQRQVKKILAVMEHDRTTQSSSKRTKKHHMKARLVNRIVNPFMDSHNALSFGLAFDPIVDAPGLESEDEDTSGSEGEADDEDAEERAERKAERSQRNSERRQRRELLYQSDELLRLIPDLKTDINILDDEQLVEYCRYLDYSIHSARQDDTGHLAERTIVYLSQFVADPKLQEAPSMIEKFRCGWRDYFTTRQLCPFDMLKDFDADWEQFCEDVVNGRRIITPGDFSAFLYCEGQAEKGSADAGLLRSPLFLACYKSLWTGPSSAYLVNGRKAKTAGKPPITWKYKLFSVTPRSLAYTAVLVRHALMTDDFAATDPHGFNYEGMFTEILQLFKDEKSTWCKETLAWWNSKVFANAPHGNTLQTANLGRLTTAERIRKERKAAKKGKKPAPS